MSMSDNREIFYQGAPGAFSEAAILSHWPQAVPLGCETFADVFHALSEDAHAIGLLPIENAYRGPVYEVLDLLTTSPLSIWGEVVQPVELALLAYGHHDLSRIKRVRSHPQALMQSQNFCRTHGLVVEVALDTAGSAKDLVMNPREEVGAIAGPRNAKIYGLEIVRQGIQDHPDNRTRFWLLSQTAQKVDSPLGKIKTTIVLDLPDMPGSLVHYLEAFSALHINLSKVESRPRPAVPFAYRFWIDAVGTQADLEAGWKESLRSTEWCRRLGTYPVLSE